MIKNIEIAGLIEINFNIIKYIAIGLRSNHRQIFA